MDPMSALVVATSVLVFVEYGGKLVSRYFEVRETVKGQPPEVLRLHEAARDLKTMASEARNKLEGLKSSYSQYSGSPDSLLHDCIDTEKHLNASLQKLTADPNSRLTYRGSQALVAIRSLWAEKENKKWEEKLEEIKNQIKMNVLMCLWDEARETRELAKGIDEGVGHIVETVHHIDTTMNALQGDFERIAAGRHLADSSGEERFADALWASSGLLDLPSRHPNPPIRYPDSPPQTPPPVPVDQDPRPTAEQISKKILESLKFDGMTDRSCETQEMIVRVGQLRYDHGEQRQPVEQDMDFMQWLQSQNKAVFWITGKPASGKSTLMKFISTRDSLRSHLHVWTGYAELLIASFYFWGPGSKIQKSRVGLLRSLLHQLLSQRPDLCKFVAPRRRVLFGLAGINVESPAWDWTELRECLLRFASLIKGESRLALFIDGLDEYDGNQEQLVAFLKKLHKDHDPKLCVSSRPWNIFSDAFRLSPSLTMEALTQPDIDIYVEGHLGESVAIQQLRALEPESINKLMEEVRTRAEGVFLWVVLVVEQLVITARDRPQLSVVWEVFNGLPRGLEKLYDTIQDKIKPDEQEVASKLYQLVMEWKRTWSGQIEATFLWLAADGADPAQKVTYPEPHKDDTIVPLITRLLAGHTKGILQISAPNSNFTPQTVDFLHRTVFDWLWKEDNWSKICKQGPAGFQPILKLVAILVSHLRSLGPASVDRSPTRKEHRKQLVFRILKVASEIENTRDNRDQLVIILDQMAAEKLLPDDIPALFQGTRIRTENRSLDHALATLAAAWCCLPFLVAKVDTSPLILRDKHRSKILSPFSNEPTPITLLEASVLGGVPGGSRHKSTEWYNEARGFSQWQVSQRLETVKFLLQKNVKPNNSLKGHLKALRVGTEGVSDIGFEPQYWSLVAKLVHYGSGLASFDSIMQSLLPGIEECRRKEEFPGFKIRP